MDKIPIMINLKDHSLIMNKISVIQFKVMDLDHQ